MLTKRQAKQLTHLIEAYTDAIAFREFANTQAATSSIAPSPVIADANVQDAKTDLLKFIDSVTLDE